MPSPVKHVTVTITIATIMRAVWIGILLFALYAFFDLVLVILTAVVIASAVEPAARWFGRHGILRVPAILIVYIGSLLALAGLFYALIPPFIDDALNLLRMLPQYLDGSIIGGGGALADGVRELPEGATLTDFIVSLREIVSGASGGFFAVLSDVFGGVISAVLIVVLSFYLSVQDDGVANFLRIVTPAEHEAYVLSLWRRAQFKIGRWMQGQLLLAVVVGILVYVGLLILGVRYALLLALCAAVLEIIPIFGPMLAAIPAVIVAFVDGGVAAGFVVAGLYTLIQQLENHLLYPMVVSKVVGVPSILVIIALVVGARLAGFLGILLSVPVAAAFREFLNDVEERKRRNMKASA